MDQSQASAGRFAPSGGIGFDYMSILAALWRNILAIILAALIGGGLMLGYTWFFVKPSYSASVLAYINKSTVSISGADLVLGSGENVVSTYTTILKSRTTLEEIAETAGVSYDPETLEKMITTTVNADKGSFITIGVSSPSPVEAELIANTVASVLPARVSDIVEGSTLRVVDYAVIPSSRSSESLLRNFLAGLAVGGFLVCAVVALKTFIQMNHAPMITSASDLAQYYPAYPVLGVIRDLSYSEKKFKYGNYGYGKYSDYYTRPQDNKKKASRGEGGK